jgi:hypothetical protein
MIQFTPAEMLELIYSNHNGNEGESSSVSDVYRYVIIWNLLNYISNILPVFIRRWEIQTFLYRMFLPYGRAIAQAVSGRLPTAAAWVRSQVMWDFWCKVALRQFPASISGFRRQFVFHQMLNTHLLSYNGWCTKWTQSHPTLRRKLRLPNPFAAYYSPNFPKIM